MKLKDPERKTFRENIIQSEIGRVNSIIWSTRILRYNVSLKRIIRRLNKKILYSYQYYCNSTQRKKCMDMFSLIFEVNNLHKYAFSSRKWRWCGPPEIKSMKVGRAHEFCNLDYRPISGAAGDIRRALLKEGKLTVSL